MEGSWLDREEIWLIGESRGYQGVAINEIFHCCPSSRHRNRNTSNQGLPLPSIRYRRHGSRLGL